MHIQGLEYYCVSLSCWESCCSPSTSMASSAKKTCDLIATKTVVFSCFLDVIWVPTCQVAPSLAPVGPRLGKKFLPSSGWKAARHERRAHCESGVMILCGLLIGLMWAKGTIAVLHTAFGVKILSASWPVWSLERTKCADWKNLHWLLGIWGFLAWLTIFSLMCLFFCGPNYLLKWPSEVEEQSSLQSFRWCNPGMTSTIASLSKGEKWDRIAICCLMGCMLNNLRNIQNHTKSTIWWACTWTQNLTIYTLAPRTLLWMHLGAAGYI